MSRFVRLSLVTLVLSAASIAPASAGNAWYWGQITQVITSEPDGSFIVYIDNADLLSTCAYDRVNFLVSDMGPERTKAALSMVLMAFAAGKEYGVVVNLPPAGNECFASRTATQGAGVRG